MSEIIVVTSKESVSAALPERRQTKEEQELRALVDVVEAKLAEATSLPVSVTLPHATASLFAAISELYTAAGWTVTTSSGREADLKAYPETKFPGFGLTLS